MKNEKKHRIYLVDAYKKVWVSYIMLYDYVKIWTIWSLSILSNQILPNLVGFAQTITETMLGIEINLGLKQFYTHRPNSCVCVVCDSRSSSSSCRSSPPWAWAVSSGLCSPSLAGQPPSGTWSVNTHTHIQCHPEFPLHFFPFGTYAKQLLLFKYI